MGYRGKVQEQATARELRAQGLTMAEIADKIGVPKGSVSLWVRDVPFQPSRRRVGARRREPNALQRRKDAEIERLEREGIARIGLLDRKQFLVAGAVRRRGSEDRWVGQVRQQ